MRFSFILPFCFYIVVLVFSVKGGGGVLFPYVSRYGVPASHRFFHRVSRVLIPDKGEDGKIPTMNSMGYMTTDSTSVLEEFKAHAGAEGRVSLDIGAAYGLNSLPVLEQGGTVVANDINVDHLIALRHSSPSDKRHNLYLHKGAFPYDMDFEEEAFDAIVLSRVVHFLSGKEMDEGIKRLHKWLKKGGCAYFVVMSPYHHYLQAADPPFSSVYEQRVRDGERWAGLIENVHAFIPHQREQIPKFLHTMGPKTLGKALEEQGFTLKENTFCEYSRVNSSHIRTGKGYYGVIACK